MLRTALVVAALIAAAGSSRADTLPLIGVPTDYTPGQAFSFDVFAPGLVGLTDYTLEFTVSAGLPPNLPDLTVTAEPPVGLSGYPFPDDSNFLTSQNVVGGVNSYFITIQDATSGPGVNTLLGVNDRLATITISPGVNLSGPITIAFSENQFSTDRDVGFDLPPPIIITERTVDPQPVPAPPAIVLLGIGGLCLAGRARFRRNAAV